MVTTAALLRVGYSVMRATTVALKRNDAQQKGLREARNLAECDLSSGTTAPSGPGIVVGAQKRLSSSRS